MTRVAIGLMCCSLLAGLLIGAHVSPEALSALLVMLVVAVAALVGPALHRWLNP